MEQQKKQCAQPMVMKHELLRDITAGNSGQQPCRTLQCQEK